VSGRLPSEFLLSVRDPLLAAAAFHVHEEARWEELLATIAQLDDDDSLAGIVHVMKADHLRRYAAACFRASL
jgi:hypothetical protein